MSKKNNSKYNLNFEWENEKNLKRIYNHIDGQNKLIEKNENNFSNYSKFSSIGNFYPFVYWNREEEIKKRERQKALNQFKNFHKKKIENYIMIENYF